MKKRTIRYINFRGSRGVETVDSVEKENGQSSKEFWRTVRDLVSEYRIAGMDCYSSSRCTKDWNK